jgi:hypothetical protein
MNRTALVLELFQPNDLGFSRWVSKDELVGKYQTLYPTNGNMWMRNRGLSHLILKKEIINGVTHWKFDGINENQKSSRPIRKDIKDILSKQPCAHTGFKDTKNNPIVIDHKNGRYDDVKVLDIQLQEIEDFQPLCNQANLLKRTDCNNCIKSGLRFDAKKIGYDVSFIEGDENYLGTCNGCYWFDCIKFKSQLTKHHINQLENK